MAVEDQKAILERTQERLLLQLWRTSKEVEKLAKIVSPTGISAHMVTVTKAMWSLTHMINDVAAKALALSEAVARDTKGR